MEMLEDSAINTELIESTTRYFSQITAKIFKLMFSADSREVSYEVIENGIYSVDKINISILFTGTVYGEFILSFEEQVARVILGDAQQQIDQKSMDQFRKKVFDTFSEALNLIVGEAMVPLLKTYPKITMTSPKLSIGDVQYPKIKAGRSTLAISDRMMHCYFYIDLMRLDISSSYKKALAALLKKHKELLLTMAQLKEHQAKLINSEKMAALGTMAAGIAHEINTPLSTITILDEQLKDLLNDTVVNKELFWNLLNTIDVTAARIGKITHGLRMFSRDAHSDPFVSTSLITVVTDTLALCEHFIREKKIDLNYEKIESNIAIECRSVQISQVLMNLLSNAVDALENLDSKWITIEAEDLNTEVEIRITDSGHGIQKEKADRIFDPFFTTKEVGKGTGLGLSISKGIIDAHFGAIFVNANSPNTQFIIRLPKEHKEVK